MLSFPDAERRLVSQVERLSEVETLPLSDSPGRVAGERIVAPAAVPAFENSAMDGYAVRSADLQQDPRRRLEQVGTSWAGRPCTRKLEAGQCVRIFTGAAMPPGADAVIIQENAEASGDGVRFHAVPEPGAWVRAIGSDFEAGQELISPGTRIGPFHMGLLAAAGVTEVQVIRSLRVALFSSGDELVEPGRPLEPGEIYNSNAFLLSALLERLPASVIERGTLRDDPNEIDRALARAMRACDLILTCGGASVGDADYMLSAVKRLGEVEFWKIAMRPGKPLIYGRLGSARYVGLPGNPVSAAVTFIKLVRPLVLAMCGSAPAHPLRIPARLGRRFQRDTERTDFARVALESRDDGLWATPIADQSSARISSLAYANGLMILDGPPRDLEVGEQVIVEIFPELAAY